MEQAPIKDAISGGSGEDIASGSLTSRKGKKRGSGEDSVSGSFTPRKGKKLDESLIVRCGLVGETLLAVTEGELKWPDEDRALYKSDVLSILRIPVTQFALVDIVHGCPTLDCEPNLVEDGEHMHFGDEYIFCKRQCPRCPRVA